MLMMSVVPTFTTTKLEKKGKLDALSLINEPILNKTELNQQIVLNL